MKVLLSSLTAFLLSMCTVMYAQESIGIGTTSPNAKAILDIESITKGLLIPRMNTTQREAMPLTGPDIGMMVYDHDLDAPMYWNGFAWRHVGYTANFWKPVSNHLYFDEGRVAIGISSPVSTLHVVNDEVGRALQIENAYNGTVSKYGIYSILNASGTGPKYGYYGVTYPHATDPSSVYGLRHYMFANGSPATLFGLYSYIQSGGTGTHYGLHAEAPGAGNYAVWAKNVDAAGWAGYFDGRGYFSGRLGIGDSSPSYQVDIVTSEGRAINLVNNNPDATSTYGIRAQINDGASSGSRYGILSDVDLASDHTSTAYGFYTNVENNGTGTHYGLYATATGSGNYAVYASNSATDGWGGYFLGRGYFSMDVLVGTKIEFQPTGYASGGEILLRDGDGTATLYLRGNDSSSEGAEIKLYNDAGIETIQIDAEYGSGSPSRIQVGELEIQAGSDVAEYFEISEESTESIRPGMLVSIDPDNAGALLLSKVAYDKKVAGVISGANGIRTGLMLGQQASIADGDYPVAIAGRVFVFATAANGAILPGDLLTSSDRPGIAMKATNPARSSGAIIGKAMTALEDETGFVLVLISLQ